jgi:DNA repair protein RadC
MKDTTKLSKISEDTVLAYAADILEQRAKTHEILSKAVDAARFLQLKIGDEYREKFSVLFLDAQLRLIEYKELFHGTITSSSVHPRVVAKEALLLDAVHVILSHNHPSGDTHPSEADKQITAKVAAALGMFDIAVVDHIIVGPGATAFSFNANNLDRYLRGHYEPR